MSKLRITRYEADRSIISDRLVEASLELKTGPSEAHYQGPIRLDFLAENQSDVEQFIEYLQKLMGKLPISEKPVKTLKEKTLAPDSIDELINVGLTKSKTQEDLIAYLRGLNFVFLDTDYLTDLGVKNEAPVQIEPKHMQYQWMVRQTRLAKNPMSDRYDFSLIFGFRIIGDKKPRVLIYKTLSFDRKVELHWADESGINFKPKEKFYKFPRFMSYEERSRWRAEDRKLHDNPDYEPTKFYLKCKDFVKKLKPLRSKESKK